MKNIYILLISIVTLLSCSKESDRDQDTSTNSSVDYAFSQAVVLDAFRLVHQAALSSKGISTNNLADSTTIFGCDTLIVDTTSNPMTITIQFNGVCSGNDIDKTGSIIATFSSKYDALGCVVGISFNNHTYKGYTIHSGTINYSYTGLNGSLPTYSYSVNNIKIVNRDEFMYFSGNQNITVSSGESTATMDDDTYLIAGTSYGNAFAGNEFSTAINSDLTFLGNCKWISGGVATVTPENKNPRIVNFGSGCDNNATVSVYSTEQEIVIP